MKSLTKQNGNTFPSLISDFFDSGRFFGPALFENWKNEFSTPSVNISENGKAFNIEVAAPGMNKKDFKVDLEDNVLTISAEKEKEDNEETEHFTRREFSYSSFSRSFRLPEDVLADAIQCVYENGLLKLIVPKKEESKKHSSKSITVA